MADQPHDIIVLGFRQTVYTKRAPRKSDGTPGEIIAENAPDYWVKYVNRSMPQSTATEERLRHMDPANIRIPEGGEGGEKLQFLEYRWSQIKPPFDAWLSGQALPEYGIPLAAWAAINPDQVKALLASGIKSVEDVRDLSENQMGRIRLPNLRDIKRMAATYLEGLSGKEALEREAARDVKIAGLEEQLKAAMQLLEEQAKANAETQGGKKPAKAA
jgi:hypothetical protein